jgi:hypothetical protein
LRVGIFDYLSEEYNHTFRAQMGNFLYLLFAGICFQNSIVMLFKLLTKRELTSAGLGGTAAFSSAIMGESTSVKGRILVDALGWLICGSLIIFCLSQFKN